MGKARTFQFYMDNDFDAEGDARFLEIGIKKARKVQKSTKLLLR